MKRKINPNLYANKATNIVYAINLSQIFILLFFIIYSYILKDTLHLFINKLYILLLIFVIIAFINSYITVKDVNQLKHLNSQNMMQGKSLKEINNFNNVLRAQRHDFLNHLQVVYSLMQMKEYHEAQKYIDMVYEDINKINRVLKTSSLAINALLQAKVLDCEKRGILVDLKVSTRLDKLTIPDWEMCRVLGNLIDNAIYAVEKSIETKFIIIELKEEMKNYIFTVKNNGEPISYGIKEKLFEPGFTTKVKDGEGMGLYISKEIIEKYNGYIDFQSNESITTFIVTIPF